MGIRNRAVSMAKRCPPCCRVVDPSQASTTVVVGMLYKCPRCTKRWQFRVSERHLKGEILRIDLHPEASTAPPPEPVPAEPSTVVPFVKPESVK